MTLENIFSKKDLIKSHPLFEISKEAPLFIIENSVYSIDTEEINYEVNNFNGAPLIKVGSLDELDELFLERNSEAIKKVKEEINAEIKKKIFGKQFNNLDLPQRMYKEIFPRLRAESYIENIEELLEIPPEEIFEKKDSPKKSSIFKKLTSILVGSPLSEKEGNNEREEEKVKIALPPELEKVLIECEMNLDKIRREYPEEPQERVSPKKEKILEKLLEIKKPEKQKAKKENFLTGRALENKNLAIMNEELINLTNTGKNYEPKINLENKRRFYLGEKNSLTEKPKEKNSEEYSVGEEVVFVKYGGGR